MGLRAMIVQGADATANSGALASSLIATTSAARLYSVTVLNTGPSQFIQLFDSTTVPADATVPKLSLNVPANATGSFEFGDGRIFATGIVITNSTTAATKTIGAADCLIDCTYRNT